MVSTRARYVGARPCLLAALAAIVAALGTTPADATILLFDEARDGGGAVIPTGSGGVPPLDYGDNVTAALMAVPGGFFSYGDGGEGFTPDITLDIYTSLGTPEIPRVKLWTTGYGDLVNVLFGEGPGIGGSPILNVLFSAAPGYAVDLYGFDLAGFGNDYTIAGVEVLAGATSLFTRSDVLVEGNAVGPGHTHLEFGTPLSGAELLLQIDVSNLAEGIRDNIGIDSIRFGQTPPREVPEPSTGILWLVGLALALRRSR